MLTDRPTKKMIACWKKIFGEYRPSLTPNRKTGAQVDVYFREKYPHSVPDDAAFREIVAANIVENEFSRAKLPEGKQPEIRCYRTGGVMVGIDVVSGEFHVESKNMADAAAVYDDLFVFRGLDEADIENWFLVAQYVELQRA